MRVDAGCVRVKTYSSARISSAERHNERKNTDYGNINVEPERTTMNVHFKDPGEKTYMDILREKEANGEVSTRGLRQDAVLFDEMIFDVNTLYFEEHGGYEYAKGFYEQAYRYACEKYGESNIISAVMHADEVNKAASEQLGHKVYHYHMHLVAMPVVEKEVRWSKRCKDPELVGTVKEVVHQISHSKKWESREPERDNQGKEKLRKNGKPLYVKSYSLLQDEYHDYMAERGYDDFQRGERGSTTEHLSSLQYQIQKDKERLTELDEGIKNAEVQYEAKKNVCMMASEIEYAGKKTIVGNYTVSKNDYEKLTELAKEGLASRGKIEQLNESLILACRSADRNQKDYREMKEKYDQLLDICKPFLEALDHFPDVVHAFMEKVRRLFAEKAQAEKDERTIKQPVKDSRSDDGWER